MLRVSVKRVGHAEGREVRVYSSCLKCLRTMHRTKHSQPCTERREVLSFISGVFLSSVPLLKQDKIIDTELKTLQAAAVHPNVVGCLGYIKMSIRQDEYCFATR